MMMTIQYNPRCKKSEIHHIVFITKTVSSTKLRGDLGRPLLLSVFRCIHCLPKSPNSPNSPPFPYFLVPMCAQRGCAGGGSGPRGYLGQSPMTVTGVVQGALQGLQPLWLERREKACQRIGFLVLLVRVLVKIEREEGFSPFVY